MNDQSDLFDDDPKKRRDAAFARMDARSGDWQAIALLATESVLRAGWRGTGEDLRLAVYKIAGEPHHNNVWGNFCNKIIRKNWLVRIGEAHMKTGKSHARRTPLYRSAL